jgi:hypothetical protein
MGSWMLPEVYEDCNLTHLRDILEKWQFILGQAVSHNLAAINLYWTIVTAY